MTKSRDAPDISHIRSPIPPRMPTMPICPSGFWSNHSVTNSRAYSSVRSNRVGRMSRSVMDVERSSRRTRWRMIDRRIAAAGARSLLFLEKAESFRQSARCATVLLVGVRAYLRRRPRASSSATAPVRLPASSSCTVSQERVYVASQA